MSLVRDEGEIVSECLSDQEMIEGIAMMHWQDGKPR